MNKIIFNGNICNDLQLKEAGGVKVLGLRIACRRQFKTNGQYVTDFISCDAFNQTADFISRYFKKGQPILIVGRLENNNYQNNKGEMVYKDHVVVEEANFFGDSKEEESSQSQAQPKKKEKVVIEPRVEDTLFDTDITDDELPF